ncbi:MAG: hypothetical protein E7624_07715 [Ruminococcaceae bacterium]|nr:hypothetical protein [Oscillospiraceae bacterium]
MADKKRTAKSKKNQLLLPHVSDEATSAEHTETDEGASLQVQQAVDGMIRDLFGKEGGVALAARTEPTAPSVTVDATVPAEEETDEQAAPAPTLEEVGAYPAFIRDDLKEEAEQAQLEADAQPLSFKELMSSYPEEFRLLLDMEYEQELGESIGFEKIRAYHEGLINGRKNPRRARSEKSDEFERQEQETEIRQRYSRAKRTSILRLAASLAFFVLLLFYENTELMRELFGGILDISQYPAPYVLIGLQLLLLDAALCYRSLREGLAHLFSFSPVDQSPYALILILTFLYHIVLIFLADQQTLTLFFTPAALSLALLSTSELLNLYRETLAFDVVAVHRQKYAVLPRISVGGTQGSARAALAQGKREGKMLYLHPVGFVRNYVANTKKHEGKYQNLGAHFLLIMGLGAALALLGFAGGAEAMTAITVFFTAVVVCAPAISSLLTALPLFFAACFSLRGSGAIIGEMPLVEYNKNDILVFPDHDLFVAMEQRRFRLMGLCDAHRVSVLARALLERVKSPLAASISVDSESRLPPAALKLLHIDKDGVSAQTEDGDGTVAIGTADYLLKRGTAFPQSEEDKDKNKEGTSKADNEISPLYIAVDGRVCAMLSVRYVLAADAEHLLHRVRQAGFRVAVRSQDPCVREEVLCELFPRLAGSILVEKPNVNEMELRTERVDSNVVSLSSAKALARTLVSCRRVQRVGLWGKLLQLVSVVVGGAVATLSVLFSKPFSSLFLTLWMLLWCVVYAVLSYFSLRRATDDI